MVNYNCLRCGFTTNHKNNFRKHIYRKFICKPILKEIPIISIRDDFEMKEPKSCNQNVIKCNHNVITNGSKINHKCRYCNKKFSKRQNRWRHEKYFCKEKNKDNCIEDKIKQMENEITKLKIEKTKKENIINNKIENSIINSNNTIIVNNFGDENTEYITDKMFQKLILKGSKGIPSLIKQIHFNPNHPENHNVRYKNQKSKYIEIKNNNKWKYQHKKALLDNLVDYGYITLEDFKENNEEQMNELLIKGFHRLMDGYEKNKNKIIDDIELELLNGTKDIEI